APGVGYLRFFLALYPPVIASAMWLIGMAAKGLLTTPHTSASMISDVALPAPPRRGSIGIPIGVGLFTTAVVAAGLYVSLPDMERQHLQNQRLAFSARALLDTTAKSRRSESRDVKPVFFAEDRNLLMYLQFAADGEWYSASAFTPGGGDRGPMGGRPNRPFGGGPPGARP